jgi:cell division protein FtsW (lipid II flippase)
MLGWIRLRPHSWGILLPALTLAGIGLSAIYETESHLPIYALTQRQIVFLVGGLLLALGTNGVNYQTLGRWSPLMFAGVLGALVLLVLAKFLPLEVIAPLRNGARRWIQIPGIGFGLQPSELMKPVYVVALAWYLRYRRNYRTLAGLIGPFVITVVPMFLILLEPDLGTVLLFMPILFAMLFAAGARIQHVMVVVLLAVAATPVFWLVMKPYQRSRITAVMLQNDSLRNKIIESKDDKAWGWFCTREDAAKWKTHYGFQLLSSKAAIGSGGWTGKAMREGDTLRHTPLPEKHNDFIFAVIGHQFGFLGCILTVLCFVVAVVVGFDVATETDDPFGRLIAVGISTWLGTQALINVGVTVGLMPITGITLPFVSHGGSSLLTCFICIGLLINVAQHRPILLAKKPFEFDEPREKSLMTEMAAH